LPNWVEGKVVENIHWHQNLFSLKVEADIDAFTAGQFTSLALDIDGERIARPYSFLSSPGQQPLEFFFYVATDGALSNALVKLEVGDALWVKQQAAGFFTLNEVPDARDLWMLATGTGIAPYFSILGTDELWQRFQNVVLVQGVRSRMDLRYQDLVTHYQENYPQRFHFQPFVSREDCEGAIRGRIPESIQQGHLEAAVGLKLEVEHSQIMLCGNPAMVKDSVEILKQRGFRKNLRRKPGQLTTENYW
jgi:ferredoxin--NADP+ reductase